MDTPLNKAGTITDANFLFRSLGSFWTDVFTEKDTIRGYTLGQAEEISQRYLDLIEVIDNYAIDSAHVFHRERWLPIQILKSKINAVPFLFNPADSVFGAQPAASTYYSGETFRFGFPKTPTAKVYQYYVGKELMDFSIIADKVINPAKVYVYGADVVSANQTLSFNQNVFDDPALTKFDVYDDNGSPVTFIDANGVEQQEQSMTLWAYNGASDISTIYNSFGSLFRLSRPSSEFYKAVIKCIINLYSDGPTVNIIKRLFAIISNTPYILNTQETVENVFEDGDGTYVMTDKEVYLIPAGYTMITLTVGKVLSYGDFLCTNIQYYDSLSGTGGWWKRTGLIEKQLAFSRCLFYGNYINQLSFSVEPDLVTLNSGGDIVFPVLGQKQDVATFNAYLNADVDRKTTIKEKFGLVNPGDSYMIFPLDFIMENFLRTNTAFFKLSVQDHETLAECLQLVPLLKSSLPPYVYFILKIETSVDEEVYNNLNGDILVISGHHLNADGTSSGGTFDDFSPYHYMM